MRALFLVGRKSPLLVPGWWQAVPGGLAALVVGGLFWLGLLSPVEQTAYRALFELRGALPWDERVVVVAIDDESLREVGQFPWPRTEYAALLTVLARARPAVVVLDLLLSEASPDDRLLAAAIEHQGRVVLAQAWDSEGGSLLPSPRLREAALATGHVLQHIDPDGVARALPEQVQDVPALALMAARVYSTFEQPIARLPHEGVLWLNWPGPTEQLTRYSFAAVRRGEVPTSAFAGKIVLVGMTATGSDRLSTPFDRNPPTSSVYLHAAATGNFLQHNGLRPLPRESVLWGLLLIGPALSFVIASWSAVRQVLAWCALGLGWVALAVVALKAGSWLPVAPPLLLIAATAVAVGLGERLRLNAVLEQEVERLQQVYSHSLLCQSRYLPALEPASYHQPEPLRKIARLSALAESFSRSQSAQSAIASSLSVGLLAADFDGSVWFCNPPVAEWLQLQPGDNLVERLVPHWFTGEQWQADLDDLRLAARTAVQELRRGERWFVLRLQPLYYTDEPARSGAPGEPAGLLLLVEEITEKKFAEQDLSRRMQELQQLNLSKDDFLSAASHELRAPMTNMKIAIGLLEKAASREKLDAYLQILKTECAREIKLINNLLDLQRLDAPTAFSPEPLDLGLWLPPIIEPFYNRARVREQRLSLQAPPGLPILLSEPGSLERVVVELLNNACKYAPPGAEISLTARTSGDHVELALSNTGSQIDPEDLPHIYEKFYRARGADHWEQGGTGLGLALVKILMDRLGGRVETTSENNRTSFVLHLPLRHPAGVQSWPALTEY